MCPIEHSDGLQTAVVSDGHQAAQMPAFLGSAPGSRSFEPHVGVQKYIRYGCRSAETPRVCALELHQDLNP